MPEPQVHAHRSYPSLEQGIEAGRRLIGVMTNSVKQDMKCTVADFDMVCGAGYGLYPGAPDDGNLIVGDDPQVQNRVDEFEKTCTELEQCCANAQSTPVQGFGAEAEAAIDPATLAMILQLVMSLIAAWRKR